jgi:hypothetical protein
MSSLINPNPATGAPSVGPPQLANYQSPDIGALDDNITQLQNQQPVQADTSAIDAALANQNQYLSYLNQLAAGQVSTQAQIQGAQTQQLADASLQSRANSQTGTQAVAGARVTNQQQTAQDTNIWARTAQVAAQQRQQAQQSAVNLTSQIAQENASRSQLVMSAQQANDARQAQLVQDKIQLSGLQQSAMQSYSQAMYNYQETMKQQYQAAKAARDKAHSEWLAGGLELAGGIILTAVGVVGGVVLGATGIGAVAGAAVAAGGIGLITKGAGDINAGSADNATADSEGAAP